jgi:hypothetical protein
MGPGPFADGFCPMEKEDGDAGENTYMYTRYLGWRGIGCK